MTKKDGREFNTTWTNVCRISGTRSRADFDYDSFKILKVPSQLAICLFVVLLCLFSFCHFLLEFRHNL